MKITKLSATNFKGSTFSHNLAPVTMFTGENFTGKSSRVEAVLLALLGYLPGVGAKSNDLFERLASGNPMTVGIVTDTSGLSRMWEQVRGSVKYTGPSVSIVTPMVLDPGEFFGLSAPQRIKAIFSRADLPEEFNVMAVVETMKANVKNIRLEENTPETEVAISNLAAWINGRLSPMPFQSWLEEFAEGVRVKKNESEAAAKRLQQTTQGLTQVATITAPGDTEQRLREAAAELEKAIKTSNTAEAELRTVREQYRKAKLQADTIGGGEEEFRKRMEQIEATLPKEPPLKLDFDKTMNEATQVWGAYTEASGARDLAEHQMRGASDELSKTKANTECRVCGCKFAKKKHREMVKAAQVKFDEADKALEAATEVCAQAKQRYDANSAIQSSYLRYDELKTTLDAMRAKLMDKAKLSELEQAGRDKAKVHTDAVAVEAAARTKWQELDTVNRQLIADRSAAQQRAKVVTDAAKAKAEAEVLKQLQKMVAELQAKIVDKVVGPLLSRANDLCGDILRFPLGYQDGDIGYHSRTGFVSQRSMSGTEKALTYCAIGIAMAAGATDFKLVILDEMGRLDIHNKRKIIGRLHTLQRSGRIDQAILVDTAAVQHLPAEWSDLSIIELPAIITKH